MLGQGWLSASGSVSGNADRVDLQFDTFWVDQGGGEADLRAYLAEGAGNAGDRVVTALGRAGFLPQFATFPVLALDPSNGLAVFRFEPLASNIAIVRSGQVE